MQADDIIIKGGGHGAAAGVTLATERIDDFRRRVNEFYDSMQLKNQELYLFAES
ncbi:DHHA1 domain-containing protein [Candidatus Minimicrobia vallesae]|uniref:DHHA1 domain-containing protein n=1 Tax=Candidatus Minimicrobia vallesae TaxID=2841264 RepID=UPI001E331F2F|nr:DHHA1 domain-containing protein [Candidatus Minimicrobia vallesae]